MVSLKLVIGTKAGKCVQKELADDISKNFVGKKIGDKISGDAIGLSGYEFLITGGSGTFGKACLSNLLKGQSRRDPSRQLSLGGVPIQVEPVVIGHHDRSGLRYPGQLRELYLVSTGVFKLLK